jgi:hypothetical protein
MTKKDYIAIAKMLNKEYTMAREDGCQDHIGIIISIAHGLSQILKADNPQLDKDRFMEAVRHTTEE